MRSEAKCQMGISMESTLQILDPQVFIIFHLYGSLRSSMTLDLETDLSPAHKILYVVFYKAEHGGIENMAIISVPKGLSGRILDFLVRKQTFPKKKQICCNDSWCGR